MTTETTISESLIEEAVNRLDMSARLEGPNRTLFLDVGLPRAPVDVTGELLFLMRAAAELHSEIQAGEELSDIEEQLEDALKADDQHGIDEGYDIYRGLLASMLKSIWRGQDGERKLNGLSEAQTRHIPHS